MPNRIIKETIRTSKSVNGMSDFDFRLWVYLITYVDDFGRGSADPELLKGFVFPRRKGITEKQISDALSRLANNGSIVIYQNDGEPYLCFPGWEKHQTIRNQKSKFPAPNATNEELKSIESKCSRNPIQSNPNPNPNPNPNSTEPDEPAPVLIALPLNTGDEFPIFEKDVSEWEGLYPAVDIMQALRNMRGWCLANPKKLKTASGIRRFVAAWLEKEQNRGGYRPSPAQAETKNGNVFLELAEKYAGEEQNAGGWPL
jgi:hypothetical protein